MSKFYDFIVLKHYHAVMQFGSRSGLVLDNVLVVKFMGGIMSTFTKMSRGFCPGGVLSYTPINICSRECDC